MAGCFATLPFTIKDFRMQPDRSTASPPVSNLIVKRDDTQVAGIRESGGEPFVGKCNAKKISFIITIAGVTYYVVGSVVAPNFTGTYGVVAVPAREADTGEQTAPTNPSQPPPPPDEEVGDTGTWTGTQT